ncbi:unnamed protein product [Schistosoma mattheei]|uniref:Uncharacterized protein n=1 Tax=Schistosoma mattheei TaxID=31246 RepID=A0A183NL78_9TREM|nr:unnamed protein product [Schistosoma mattheei]
MPISQLSWYDSVTTKEYTNMTLVTTHWLINYERTCITQQLPLIILQVNPSDDITESTKVKRLNKSKLSNSFKSQSLHRRGDLIESDQNDIIKMKAVLNNTALLPCRPDKRLLTENGVDENTKGTVSPFSLT